MKTFINLFVSILITATFCGAEPVRNTDIWLPYQVRVDVMAMLCSEGPFQLELAGQITSGGGGLLNCQEIVVPPRLTTYLQPYKRYTLRLRTMTGGKLSSGKIWLQPFTFYHEVGTSFLSSKSPIPYTVFINGVDQNLQPIDLTLPCAPYDRSWTIEVREKIDPGPRPGPAPGPGPGPGPGPNPAPGVDPIDDAERQKKALTPYGREIKQGAPGDAIFPELGPGRSPNANIGSFAWYVRLGQLRYGGDAGTIQLRAVELTSGVYNPAILLVSRGTEDTTELEVINVTLTETVRQVKAPQALADVVPTGTDEFEIRFYLPGQFTGPPSPYYTINPGALPFVTHKISKPGTDRLQLTEIRNGVSKVSEIKYEAATTTWSAIAGSGTEQRTETRQITFPSGDRQETIQIKDSTGAVAYEAIQTLRNYAWGWEPHEYVENPGAKEMKTTYAYITDALDFNYSKVDTITYNDGYWEKHEYVPDGSDSSGRISKVRRPWKDGTIDDPTYDTSYSYYAGLPQTIVDSYGDESNFFRRESYLNSNTGDGFFSRFTTPGGLPLPSSRPQHTEYYYDSSAPPQKLFQMRYAIGQNDTAETYVYDQGNYNVATKVFTPGAGDDWRMTIIHGRHRWADQGDAVPYRVGDYMSFDELHIVAFKSTKEALIRDERGNLVQQEMFVYDPMGDGDELTPSDADFILLEKRVFTYDNLGHLTQSERRDGATGVARILYTADWKGGAPVEGDLKLSETDEAAVETVYTYDTLKRLLTATKKGVSASGGFPEQYDIVTTYTYDANSRTTSKLVSSGSLSLTQQATFDKAGRTSSETDQAGLTTSYDYNNGGRSVTVTLPGTGRTSVKEQYFDRRPKSTTGTAVVNEYYDYGVDPTDGDWKMVSLGSISSPRWRKTFTNLRGQVSKEEQPGYSQNIVTTYEFNLFGLIFKLTKPGSPEQLYEYNSMGEAYRVGASATVGVIEVTLASMDRITDTETFYEGSGNNWYRVTTSKTYLTDNSDTPTSTSVTKERVRGFASASVASETISIDVDSQQTTRTNIIDRATKKTTIVTDAPDSTLNATNITINGLAQAESSATVSVQAKYFYDVLGRLVQTISPLGFTDSKTYKATTGQLETVTDAAGVKTMYEYYLATDTVPGAIPGKLKCETRANGTKTYLSYTPRGEPWQKWGNVPYPEERTYTAYGELYTLKTFQVGTGWAGPGFPSGQTGQTTTWNYQESTGYLLSKVDAAGNAVTYTYSDDGRILTRTWGRLPAVITTYGFDPTFIDQTTITYSGGPTTPNVTFSNFDRRGLPRTIEDGSGTHALAYDSAGRLLGDACTAGLMVNTSLTRHYSSTYGMDYVQFNTQFNFDRFDYAYDVAGVGRLKSVDYNYGGDSGQYGYLANSDLVQVITNKHTGIGPTEWLSTKCWEFGTRLRSIRNAVNGVDVSSHTYAYDSIGRRVRCTLADGSAWTYDYDDRDELVGAKRTWSDFSPVAGQQFEYTYDNIGNRTNARRGGDAAGANLRSETLTPNNLNQVASRYLNSANVDVVGAAIGTVTVNGVAATVRKGEYFWKEAVVGSSSTPTATQIDVYASANGQNTPITSGRIYLPKATVTFSFVHDADGNVTDDGAWLYTWDAENRLKSMESSTTLNPASKKKKLDFEYDHSGRRISKTVWSRNTADTGWENPVTSYFIYDEWRVIAELNSSKSPVRSYMWGLDLSDSLDGAGGVGGLLMVLDYGTAQSHFAGYDGHGNVATLVNSSTLAESAKYEYAPFGEVIRSTGSISKTNPFRFSTKFTDEETSLVYYGARYYNPDQGRWIGRDPTGEAGGLNLYGFALNDPSNLFDPWGRAPRGPGHHPSLWDIYKSLLNEGGGWGAELIGEWMVGYYKNVHGNGRLHRVYNDAVWQELGAFLEARGATMRDLAQNLDLAKEWCDHLMNVRNPIIRGFELLVTKGGRTAAAVALAKATAKVAKKIAKAGARVAVVGMILAPFAYAGEFSQAIIDYGNSVVGGDDAMITLNAVDVAIAFQNMTGNYYAMYVLLDILLE